MDPIGSPRARLIATWLPRNPTGAVLVLHGGGGRAGAEKVSAVQLSVLRMVPLAARIAVAGRGRLAVFRLLNSQRGWANTRTPVDDARWALAQLRSRVGDAPIGLVGHSLGGRAAILAAPEEGVRSVVALAPWLYPTDGDVNASGRRILFVHGTADRIASPERSAAVARALARSANVGYISVRGGNHAMLGRHAPFDRYAAQFMIATLDGASVNGPVAQVVQGIGRVDA
jgi:dienelactone hydrolase